LFSGIEMTELSKKVNDVLTEISGFGGIESLDMDKDLEELIERAKLRRLIDVTDKLWEILKCKQFSNKYLKILNYTIFFCRLFVL